MRNGFLMQINPYGRLTFLLVINATVLSSHPPVLRIGIWINISDRCSDPGPTIGKVVLSFWIMFQPPFCVCHVLSHKDPVLSRVSKVLVQIYPGCHNAFFPSTAGVLCNPSYQCVVPSSPVGIPPPPPVSPSPSICFQVRQQLSSLFLPTSRFQPRSA